MVTGAIVSAVCSQGIEPVVEDLPHLETITDKMFQICHICQHMPDLPRRRFLSNYFQIGH